MKLPHNHKRQITCNLAVPLNFILLLAYFWIPLSKKIAKVRVSHDVVVFSYQIITVLR